MDIIKRCEWCGKEFHAHTLVTRFCSRSCTDKAYKYQKNRARIEQAQNEEETQVATLAEIAIKGKDFISPSEAGILLGTSRASVYRYLQAGIFPCLQLGNRTIIRRKDIENIFDNPRPYRKRFYHPREKVDENNYYNLAQLMKKFHVSKTMIHNRIEKFHIAKIYQGRNVFYKKEDIDQAFSDIRINFNRQDYYTADEVVEKFGMTHGAVMSFVKRHSIPRITHGRTVYYSKVHINTLKKIAEGVVDPNYYTRTEISKKYGLTKDQVSYLIKRYKIPYKRIGAFSYYPRVEVDKALLERNCGEYEVLINAKD